MKLPLEVDTSTPVLSLRTVQWKSCPPFLENCRATLIHRPRKVTVIKIGAKWPAHLAVHAWCGNQFTGTKKFTFLESPPELALICARCEQAAVAKGLPSASSLAGRHVHLGGMRATQLCCIDQ